MQVDPTQPGEQNFEGESFSCYVRCTAIQGEDEGAIATFAYKQGGGIDISPGDSIDLQITNDAAAIVESGALLRLTLSKVSA